MTFETCDHPYSYDSDGNSEFNGSYIRDTDTHEEIGLYSVRVYCPGTATYYAPKLVLAKSEDAAKRQCIRCDTASGVYAMTDAERVPFLIQGHGDTEF